MSIPVKCQCGAGFAAKDELAGKTVRCPKCSQPLTIPAPKPAAGDSLFDDIGLAPVVTGPTCTNCGASMPPNAVLCVKCGYHTKLGRQLGAVSSGGGPGAPTGGGGGHGGHGNVAGDLLARAAQAVEDDREAERAKTSEGMPVWVYIAIMGVLLGFAGLMSVMRQKDAMVLTGRVLIIASLMADNWCFGMVVKHGVNKNIGVGLGVLFGDIALSAIGIGIFWFVEDWYRFFGLYLWGAVWKIYAMVEGEDCGIYLAAYKISGMVFTVGVVLIIISLLMGDEEEARAPPPTAPAVEQVVRFIDITEIPLAPVEAPPALAESTPQMPAAPRRSASPLMPGPTLQWVRPRLGVAHAAPRSPFGRETLAL